MAADNQALKLLVAGIVGAVVGAAAAEHYHRTGPFQPQSGQASWMYRSWNAPASDDAHWRAAQEERDDWDDWDDFGTPPRSRSRAAKLQGQPQVHGTCWKDVENWDFETVRRPVPCPHHRRPWSS